LTPIPAPDCLLGELELSPNTISRLTAIKSLLDLGDLELVAVAASRLEEHRGEPDIEEILADLTGHRFSDAAGKIEKLLSDGIRIARWLDPAIALLDAELKLVSTELADMETEQAELEHLLSRFQAAHNEALGARIARLLKLRMRLLEKQIQANPEKQTDYEQAARDFEDFQQDQEAQKKDDARTKWELSEEEQKEFKALFRKGSKLCHPDLAPPEHHDAAAEMFRQLRTAYDEGDLERVRLLVQRCATGLFDMTSDPKDSDERRMERLKAKISGIREALERVRASILQIKSSPTYRTMVENPEWIALFEKQAVILDQEIDLLSGTLEGSVHDDA
jgi:hypothetical protein